MDLFYLQVWLMESSSLSTSWKIVSSVSFILEKWNNIEHSLKMEKVLLKMKK